MSDATGGEQDDRRATPSEAQALRRQRILGATRRLASAGGYDAVQMRTVAEEAQVALGTLYRYFPSKVHLLVSVLEVELQRARDRLVSHPAQGATAGDRVVAVLHTAGADLRDDERLTEAMTRAFMFADASAKDTIARVLDLFTDMVTGAVRPDAEVASEDRMLAEVVADLWFAAMVSWVTGRSTAEETSARMEGTVRLVVRDEDPAPVVRLRWSGQGRREPRGRG